MVGEMSDSNKFPDMTTIVPHDAAVGIAKTTHHEVSRFEAMMSSIRGIATTPRKLAQLHVGGQLMMTDADFEHNTNYEVCRQSRGDVMIAGLGLGMILHPILKNPKVESVTVIEKHQDVVDPFPRGQP